MAKYELDCWFNGDSNLTFDEHLNNALSKGGVDFTVVSRQFMDDYQREIEGASSSSDPDAAGVILGIDSSADKALIQYAHSRRDRYVLLPGAYHAVDLERSAA